jgi:hypothetical protein
VLRSSITAAHNFSRLPSWKQFYWAVWNKKFVDYLYRHVIWAKCYKREDPCAHPYMTKLYNSIIFTWQRKQHKMSARQNIILGSDFTEATASHLEGNRLSSDWNQRSWLRMPEVLPSYSRQMSVKCQNTGYNRLIPPTSVPFSILACVIRCRTISEV